MHRGLSVSLSDLSTDTGLGSRSVSSLSLASDDVDETDSQRLSRDKLERELMVAYSKRRPLIRPLDLDLASACEYDHLTLHRPVCMTTGLDDMSGCRCLGESRESRDGCRENEMRSGCQCLVESRESGDG